MLEYRNFEVFWDGFASIRVRDNEFTVSVDPSEEFSPDFEAGIILITSNDNPSFDKSKLKKICGRGTCVVMPESLSDENVPCPDVEYLKPGETVDIYNVEITCLETEGGLAYRFNMQGTSFLASGKSSVVENAIDLENQVDVAFLSASEPEELNSIVKTSVRIKPDLVVPYYYREKTGLEGLKAELHDRNIDCQLLREK